VSSHVSMLSQAGVVFLLILDIFANLRHVVAILRNLRHAILSYCLEWYLYHMYLSNLKISSLEVSFITRCLIGSTVAKILGWKYGLEGKNWTNILSSYQCSGQLAFIDNACKTLIPL